MPGKSVQIVVAGRVQGVFFRKRTMEMAVQLGVTGYVLNLPDGRVKIEAHGDTGPVDNLIAWCRTGPPSAKVTDVQVIDIPEGEYPTFTIRR
jgi:acylphosphatase